MTLRGCIFDLGNTLAAIPFEYDEEECIARILGASSTDSVRSTIYRLCDRFPGQGVEDFLERFDREVNPTGDLGIRARIARAWDQSIEAAQLMPGAIETLEDLRSHGIRLALVTNTPPTTNRILDRLGLRDLFDVIVMSCDTGLLKPDPRIFQIALDRLATTASETLVVGDKIRTDILGGAVLGLRSILVETRMTRLVEDGKSYVDAIIPFVGALKDTGLYKTEIARANSF